MRSYLFFVLDGEGRSLRRTEQHCASKRAAIQFAKGLSREHTIDIWTDGCLIERVEKD